VGFLAGLAKHVTNPLFKSVPERLLRSINRHEDFVVSGMLPRFPGESQGGILETLAMKTPERLRPGLIFSPGFADTHLSS
jgi:hypothetical protein